MHKVGPPPSAIETIENSDEIHHEEDTNSIAEKKIFTSEGLYFAARVFIFSINVFAWILSIIFICIGIWIMEEKSELGIDSVSSAPAIMFLVVGSLLFLFTFTGCVGTLRENLYLLKLYLFFIVALFLIEIITAVLALVLADKTEDRLFDLLKSSITEYHDDPDKQTIMDVIQRTFECCGAYSFHDWEHNPYFKCLSPDILACGVPYSCCRIKEVNSQCGFGIRFKYENDANLVIYTEGCITTIKLWINEHLFVIGALGFALAFSQLILILTVHKIIIELEEIAHLDVPTSTNDAEDTSDDVI